jgi:FixJ family two-component response regulator
MRPFMQRLFAQRAHLLALGTAVALLASGSALAQDKPTKVLESAGALAFGPDNVLFVGDTKRAAVHAFELRPADITPQTNVVLGNAHTFEGRDLIGGIDRKLAALLGTSPDQIVINGLVVHRPSKQIFVSVHRGRGPDALPVIVKVNDGRLEVLDLDKLPHSKIRIADVPGQEILEFGQRERNLVITDITYYQGEIFVAGISNEEFASKLRRIRLNKPVKLHDLTQVIQRLLAIRQPAPSPHAPHLTVTASSPGTVIFVIDDDNHVRDGVRTVLEGAGQTVEDYPTCEEFLEAYRPGCGACLLIDAYLPGMNGLELLQRLHDAGDRLPAIMITGDADVPMAVQAMKAGASDFIEKPIGPNELVVSVERALEQSRDSNKLFAWRETAANQVAGLTPRQRQIMELVLAGHPNKNIAADLGISQRTVENHRASIMKKTGSKSLPALTRLALAAAWNSADERSFNVDLQLPPRGK